MAGGGGVSALKPSAIMLLISGSLLLTAIVLTAAPRTVTSDSDHLELVEVELDAGDTIRIEVEGTASGATAELILLSEDSALQEPGQQATLSRIDQGFDGSIVAGEDGRHQLSIHFQELQGEAQVRYTVEGHILSVWLVALAIAVPAGAWGAWLKRVEDDEADIE